MSSTPYTAESFKALKQSQIVSLAAKGRAWLLVEGKALAEALINCSRGGRKDGTYASIEGQLEDMRAAWKLAK